MWLAGFILKKVRCPIIILVESGDDDSIEIFNNEHFRKQKKINKEIFILFCKLSVYSKHFQATNKYLRTFNTIISLIT